MRTIILGVLILFFALGSGTAAWARLGETEDQLVQRYGKPFLKQRFAWCVKDNFNVQGFSIVVTLLNGISVGESYRISSGSLTDFEVVELLDANCQGYSWDEVPANEIPKEIFHPVKQMWRRPNGSTAISTGTSIEFKSIDLLMAEENANKPPPAPSTAGF